MRRVLLFSLSIAVALFATVVVGAETLTLNPAKVRELLLTQGLGIPLLNASLEVKKQDLPQALSRYDTQLQVGSDHTFDKSARTSTFFGSRTDTTHWNVGLEQKTPLGTTLGINFQNERKMVFNPSAITGTPSRSSYEPALEFQFKQSLGSNIAGAVDRGEVKKTKFAIGALDFKTRHEILNHIIEAQTLYWNWVLAKGSESTAKEALKTARNFLNTTYEKEKLGLVEKTDRLGAQALVARREAEVATLESQTAEWERKLKTILNLEPHVQLAFQEEARPSFATSEEEAITYALQHRLDLLGLKQEAEAKNVQLVVAKNKRLPIIDLSSTLRLNEVAIGDYERALSDIDNPKWVMGLQIKFPLFNSFARGEKKRAEYERLHSLLTLKQLEQTIVQEVSQKLKSALLAQRTNVARQEAANLNRQKLDHALDQYKKARFSAELILQYQDDYLFAKQEHLKAKRDYALAILALQQAKNEGFE